MKRIRSLFYGLVLAVLITVSPMASATAVSVPPLPLAPTGLVFTQLKVTGEEYLVLQNNSLADIEDLSRFSLRAFNNVNLSAAGVTTSNQSLPQTVLGAGEWLLLSATIRPTCGATLAGKLSLSLVDGGGNVQIIMAGTATIVDSVSWSASATGQIMNVPASSKAPISTFYRYESAIGFAWQQAELDPSNHCQLIVVEASGANTVETPVVGTDTENSSEVTSVIFPSPPNLAEAAAMNLGLSPPQITELLPNPTGTGNDTSDEYVELFNPNDREFDVSGYTIRTGNTGLYSFTFSDGVVLPSRSYTSYLSADTGLSLSNSGGRAQLLDPARTVLATTASYGTARDGQAWTLANGNWYWSLTPTAGASNIVNAPIPAVKTASTPKSKATKVSAVSAALKKPKTVKAAKVPKPKKDKASKPTRVSLTPTAAAVTARPVQTKIVALVAGLALLYGAYEYRADLANGFFKLRTKLKFRGSNRR